MSFITNALRGNAHTLNYVLLAGATLVPVLLYANMRSPTQDQVEAALNENFSESVQKVRENTDKINTFWKNKRNSQEMDAVYSQLLRSGSSSVKRHYELTGKLSDTEATQNPEYARMQRLLALPPTDAEKEANAAAKGPSNASSPPAKPQRA